MSNDLHNPSVCLTRLRSATRLQALSFGVGESLRLQNSVSTVILIALVAMAGALATGGSTVNACNIPVFRYALERWTPDVCEVIVFQDGALSGADSTVVHGWSARSKKNAGHANADVIQLDVSTSGDRERLELWREIHQDATTELPHVLIRTKLGQGRFVNHWHGTLGQAEQLGIFESPARVEIRHRLLAGHSVVWLLVGSKDREKTARAKKLAEDTFQTLVSKVTLPEGIGLPGSELYADLPLVVKFSLLEIDPEDPKETLLIHLLTGLRMQAFEEGEPLLVPIFGRGRALEVLPARDVSARLIEELTIFLSGACSCQVKEQNPGFDLLIEADWEGELFGEFENRPPDRSEEEGKNRSPVLVPIPRGRN